MSQSFVPISDESQVISYKVTSLPIDDEAIYWKGHLCLIRKELNKLFSRR